MCKTCQEICPFSAIIEEEVQGRGGKMEKQMRVIEGICHGCGACAASCRPGAISLKGCTDGQVHSAIESLASNF